MEDLTVKEIAQAVHGKLLCGDPKTEISYVSIDSRDIRENTIFTPIIGAKVDAHQFIEQVFEAGAKATFTSRGEIVDESKPHILVLDTEQALVDLAIYYRARFQIPVIGVTGSVGKTSTKEMIAAALSTKYKVLKTAGNYNSTIGLPLMIFQLDHTYEIAVLEMGISHFGEMDTLVSAAHPETAVVTNIGVAHIGNLKSQENIRKEKLKIAQELKTDQNLYLNGNDAILLREAKERHSGARLYGYGEGLDYFAKDIHVKDGKQCFTFVWPQGQIEVEILQIGLHNVENAVVAMAIALQYGIDPQISREGIAAYEGLPMRQQILHLRDGIKLIDDTYNASPDSIKSEIGVLKLLDNPGKKIAVLADVLELGELSQQCHYELGCSVATSGIDGVVAIGPEMKALVEAVQEKNPAMLIRHFDRNQDAADYLAGEIQPGDALLVKGSRGMHLEEVVQALQEDFAQKK